MAKLRLDLASWCALLIIAAGAFLRFVYLDSDPNYYDWIGYITDEGRWVQAARGLSLHGTVPEGLGRLHLILAPAFQLFVYGAFDLFGVTMASARVVAAVAGTAVLVVFWLMLRRTVSAPTALFGLALVTFQSDLVALSRVAVPESLGMLEALVVYWTLCSFASIRASVTAGLVTGLALATKVTMAPLIAVGSLLTMVTPNATTGAGQARAWLRRFVSYEIGVFALPAAAVVAVLLLKPDFYRTALVPSIGVVSSFLEIRDVFSMMNVPFSDGLGLTRNLWAIGLWVSALAMVANRRAWRAAPEARYLVGSAIWIGVYFLVVVFLSYFPTRYQVHLLLPLAIHLVCALSLFFRLGPSEVVAALTGRAGIFGGLQGAVLVFPGAVLLSPFVSQSLRLFGADPGRIVTRLGVLLTMMAGLWVVAYARRSSQTVTWWFVWLPAVMCGIIALQAVAGVPFWPTGPGSWHVLTGIGSSIGAWLLAGATASRPWEPYRWNRLAAAAIVTTAATGMVARTATYLHPRYTMRTTSAQLQTLLSGCSSIGALRSEGLFNGNTLRYRSYDIDSGVECLVTVFRTDEETREVRPEFDLMSTYAIAVSSDYCRAWSPLPEAPAHNGGVSAGCSVAVEVLRRPPQVPN